MAVNNEQLPTQAGSTYNKYIQKVQQAEEQEHEAQQLEQNASAIQQQLTWLLLSQNMTQPAAANLKYIIKQALEKATHLVTVIQPILN